MITYLLTPLIVPLSQCHRNAAGEHEVANWHTHTHTGTQTGAEHWRRRHRRVTTADNDALSTPTNKPWNVSGSHRKSGRSAPTCRPSIVCCRRQPSRNRALSRAITTARPGPARPGRARPGRAPASYWYR